jgi:hypothetical protein
MTIYSITLKAYSKIVLHSCKYPHCALNGVLIGSISKETQTVQIQDSIPLFHIGLGLAPMLEVALTQVAVVRYINLIDSLCEHSVERGGRKREGGRGFSSFFFINIETG